MADRALRGVGLGAKSFEDEQGIEFAQRNLVGFDCPKNHHFDVAFAIEAELPTEWECKKCGLMAVRSDGSVGEGKQAKPQRTHWDMLRERRSIPELEDILAEQLTKLRESDDI
ncbi:MAG: RNA polymerase-binding protein RbpA, partial [Arachnia sp.]